MNKLSLQERAQILGMLVEGNSLRATSRMANVAYNTVLKFVVDIGCACASYHHAQVQSLPCKRIQCDEIWSFVYAKAKNAEGAKGIVDGAGDIWTWTSLCADTKLICNWLVGSRDASCASALMEDLKGRLKHRVQISSDGHKAYLEAVEGAFGNDVDYSMLVKIYGAPSEGQKRYSPADCIGCRKEPITGNPDPAHISTSFVERHNLHMRMSMRRFTRLTNGFSKKMENHAHAVALHCLYYNYGRIHTALRVTPAMEAGLTDHVWSLEEIAALLVDEAPKQRGPYKKRISK